MISVSYDSYKVFYYVAYYQNITLAAKALYLTQPTVSHYILNLEKELNCKLFVRSKRGMQLSPEGELLFEHIAKAYEEISYGEEKLKEYLNLGKGIIKIGATETTLRYYLISALGKFKEKYPNIHDTDGGSSANIAVSGHEKYTVLIHRNTGKRLIGQIHIVQCICGIAACVRDLYPALAIEGGNGEGIIVAEGRIQCTYTVGDITGTAHQRDLGVNDRTFIGQFKSCRDMTTGRNVCRHTASAGGRIDQIRMIAERVLQYRAGLR